ncbi:hypothetical protein JHK82_052535 [Glycine max]|nr:hypothetical protein JHK86_052379 [Glycine max]KAG4914896.1 hypothetical protein JHK87_052453 [Glycine soja]KAG4926753.1 hypothetical protein JHK85_053239 [Glycine max]KAG5082382.1 hypothetical protein JHK84_052420 [Glycine max]KAG5085138.1 hypothetical protein JHK82_052535 [Glycine max]
MNDDVLEDSGAANLSPCQQGRKTKMNMGKQTLPRELLVEILSWLPVKSLLRFRCVFKASNSLSLHFMFVKLQLQSSPTLTSC